MKTLLVVVALALVLLMQSCLVAKIIVHVPGGYYVTTITMFE